MLLPFKTQLEVTKTLIMTANMFNHTLGMIKGPFIRKARSKN